MATSVILLLLSNGAFATLQKYLSKWSSSKLSLKARLHMRFLNRFRVQNAPRNRMKNRMCKRAFRPVYTCDFRCDFGAILRTKPAPAYPARVYSRVTLRQNTAKLAEIRKKGVLK